MAVTCTPEALGELAKCFLGLSQDQQDAIQTYLMCLAANTGGGGGSITSIVAGDGIEVTNGGGPVVTVTNTCCIQFMTYAERQAADPTLCKVVIDTTLNLIFYGNGSEWVQVPGGGSGPILIYTGAALDPNSAAWIVTGGTASQYGNDVALVGAVTGFDNDGNDLDGTIDLTLVAAQLTGSVYLTTFGPTFTYTPVVLPNLVGTLILIGSSITSFLGSSVPQATAFTIRGSSLASVDISGHATVSTASFDQNSACVSVDASNCASLQILDVHGSGLLASLDISGSNTIASLSAQNCALPVSDVNAALVQLDGSGVLNGTVDLSGQTPPAPPSGLGAAAAAALIINGWTVTTD